MDEALKRLVWEELFAWVGPVLTSRTAIGRTTIDVLS
jgi:hypothetical protein